MMNGLNSGVGCVFYGCPEMPRPSHYFLPRLLFGKKQMFFEHGCAAGELARLFPRRGKNGRESGEDNRVSRIG